MDFITNNKKGFMIGAIVLGVIFTLLLLVSLVGSYINNKGVDEENLGVSKQTEKIIESADSNIDKNVQKVFKGDDLTSYGEYMEGVLRRLIRENSGLGMILDRGAYVIEKDLSRDSLALFETTQPYIEAGNMDYKDYELTAGVVLTINVINLGVDDITIVDKGSYYLSENGREYPIKEFSETEMVTAKSEDMFTTNIGIDNSDFALNTFDKGELHLKYKLGEDEKVKEAVIKGYQVIKK